MFYPRNPGKEGTKEHIFINYEVLESQMAQVI